MASYPFTSTVVFGSTGLVGSFILPTLLAASPSLQTTTISRRAPKPASASPPPSNLNTIIEGDSAAWASKFSSLSPVPHTVFSAVGTTRAAAGGIQNQWKIDHDLNVELARAAKAVGTKTFVFISSGGTRGWLVSSSPYAKMKNGVEDTIRDLGFENAIILRPGAILGERDHVRTVEGMFQSAIRGLGQLSPGAKDAIGQDAEVIGRAAVRAAEMAAEGKAPSKYWTVEAAGIVRLGRTEWDEKKHANGAEASAETS